MTSMPSSRPHGFSLIELMVVLAIVGLLMAVAVPQYQTYVRRAHRVQAMATLLEAASWLERMATAQGRYPTDAATGGPGLPQALRTSPQGHYAITLISTNGQDFTLTATPQGDQTQDRCGVLTLTHQGEQAAEGGTPCW